METFPGPKFFTWRSYVARVPYAAKGSLTLILPTASCRRCDVHSRTKPSRYRRPHPTVRGLQVLQCASILRIETLDRVYPPDTACAKSVHKEPLLYRLKRFSWCKIPSKHQKGAHTISTWILRGKRRCRQETSDRQ